MGWFPSGWFTSSPERRIAHAQWLLDRDNYNDARLELEGVDHPEAARLRAQALEALIELNLMEWIAQRGAANTEESKAALARARSFGATKERVEHFVPRGGSTVTASHKLRR